ncbi:MAG: ribosome hibernation-promoting factor, HPF/YfiA family [Nitrospirota bacterium]
MQISITGRHMEVTNALKNYTEHKVSKIDKYTSKPTSAVVTLSVEKYRHIADISVKINGHLIQAAEETEEMYISIDKAMDKIERQARKYKEKLINHKPRQQDNISAPSIEELIPPQIVKKKQFKIEQMRPEEAVTELNNIGKDFFLFTNSYTDRVNVIYKRKNGNVGLIELIY